MAHIQQNLGNLKTAHSNYTKTIVSIIRFNSTLGDFREEYQRQTRRISKYANGGQILSQKASIQPNLT